MGTIQTRQAIARMEKVGLADFYAGMILVGGSAILMAATSYVATSWLRGIDQDAPIARDQSYLVWILLIGVIISSVFGVLFRRSMTRRKELKEISKEVAPLELLELAVDVHSAGWVVWLLRKNMKASHSGIREAVSAVHFAKGSMQVYRQLEVDADANSRLEAIGRRAAARVNARPLSPMLRTLYVVPLLVLIGVGWLSLRPQYLVEPYNYITMIVFLVGMYSPFLIIGLITRGRGEDLAADWDAALRGVSLDNLILLAGAGVRRSKLELARRGKENVPGAKEGMREVERFRAGNRFSRF